MKKIPLKELDAILREVSTQLEPVVKAEVLRAAEKLSKAIPGESTTDEVPKDDSATKEASDDKATAPPPKDDAPPADDKPADAPTDEPPAPEAPVDGPPVDDGLIDPAADGDIDSPEALQAAYSTLPLEELQVHYLAIRAAMMAAMPAAAPAPEAPIAAPPAAVAPPAAPPMAPSAAPPAVPPMADPTLKAEMPADPNGSVSEIKKSEKLIEDLKKQVTDQTAVIAELIDISAALKKHAERPIRKSAASLSEVRRATGAALGAATVDFASLSKSEMKVLVRKTVEKPLSANDRARMHDFISGKYEDVESVKDLLVA